MKKRKRLGRKLLSFILTLAMVVGLMPGLSLTAYATQNKVNYLEGSWDQEKGECAFTENSTDSYTVVGANSTAWGAGTYVVNSEVTISGRITVNGTANLILCDGAKLTASNGITVEDTNALYIYPGSTAESIEGSGQLIASTTGNGNNAGIGGTYKRTGGTVTIYGGEVTATSLGRGAGIGGGAEGGAGGTVTVYGGVVTATSKSSGAGIGGGEGGAGGTVTVYGGKVTATSNSSGAGIGGGSYGAGGTVTVYGGEVTATSESWGAGIGGGWCKSGGTVSIYGGTVTASGGNKPDGGNYSDSMGIGNGCYESGDITAGTLTLGSGVKLYNGTDNNGDVLDGIDGTERSYNGSRPQNMFAETVVKLAQTVTAPTKATDLTYKKDQAQALLTKGAEVTTGNTATGSIQYKVGDEGTWSTDIPTGTNAGNYSVYYRVLGNETYAEYAPTEAISVTIAKADPETPEAFSAIYGQQAKDIKLPTGWSWAAPETKFESTGEVELKANFEGDANYNQKNNVSISGLVAKAAAKISYKNSEVTKEYAPDSLIDDNDIENTGDATPTYESSKTSVATVDGTGLVTIKGIGETTITANVANDTENYTYETRTASYKLTVNPISTEISTAPTAAEITYGQKLYESTLTGGEAVSRRSPVEGTFAWKEPNLVPNASDNGGYDVVFTPTDTKYAESTCNVKVKVKKAAAPATKDTLLPGQKPAEKNAEDLVYTGEPIELVKAPTTDLPIDYEAYYSTDGEDWSKDIPKKKGPGSNTVKVKYVSKSGNYEDIPLDDIPVTITVDKSILSKAIQEATEYKEEITNKNTDGIYDSVISTLETAISTAETAYNNEGISENGIVSAIDALTTALNKAKADVKDIDDQRAADPVIALINALPDTDQVTTENKDQIEAARAAYNALTDDQKNKVTNLVKLTNAENAWVTVYRNAKKNAADGLVNDEDSVAAKALVNNAKNAIDSITYDQSKGLDVFKAAVDAIITKVTADVEDQKAADVVITQINALPAANQVTTGNKNAIEAARAAYDDLTVGQKSKVTDETLKKLTDAEDALAAAIVSDRINALPVANQVTTGDKDKIEAARAAYNALTDGQKSKVSAEILKKLTDAEAALKDLVDAAEVEKVVDKINKLPSSDKVTLTDKESVEAARKAYDALTDDQKKKVNPETLKKLTDAEDKLVILQVISEVSAKTGSDMTYTGNPIQLINTPTTKLPEGYKMVYAVTTENKAPTDDKLYTTEIPTKTEAGTYYVWYKAVGDSDHNDTVPACVIARILAGEIRTETDIAEDVPKSTINGLNTELAKTVLSESEKQEVESGAKLTVSLEVTNITGSEPGEDKKKTEQAAKKAVSSAKVGMYLDLSLYKQIGNEDRKKISSLNGRTITVTLDVPKSLKAPSGVARTYYLIRVHEGKAEILAKTKKMRITFATGAFSTYAIAYSDAAGKEKTGTSDNGKSRTDSDSGKSRTDSGRGSFRAYFGGGPGSPAGSFSVAASSGGGGGSSSAGRPTFFIKDVEYRILSKKKKTAALVWASDRKAMIIPAVIKRKGKAYKVTTIDERAFKECNSLRRVVIGKNVKRIGAKAFAGCRKLKKIDIRSKKLTKKGIGKEAF